MLIPALDGVSHLRRHQGAKHETHQQEGRPHGPTAHTAWIRGCGSG